MNITRLKCVIVIFFQILLIVKTQDIRGLFSQCRKSSKTFDICMKNALNELNIYYKSGKLAVIICFTTFYFNLSLLVECF